MRARWMVVLALMVLGCRRGDAETIVFAASSLREPFTALAAPFEADRPGVAVRFNFEGTQLLRTQLENGARAEVFAAADERHMEALVREGVVRDATRFACNSLVIAVPPDNPAGIEGLADLRGARRIVVAAPEVPLGQYTLEVLQNAAASLGPEFPLEVGAKIVSRELNARQVLAKLALGEADAGLVYRTDVIAARGRVKAVELPLNFNIATHYSIAVVEEAKHPSQAEAWTAMVLSAAGKKVLEAHGFIACPGR